MAVTPLSMNNSAVDVMPFQDDEALKLKFFISFYKHKERHKNVKLPAKNVLRKLFVEQFEPKVVVKRIHKKQPRYFAKRTKKKSMHPQDKPDNESDANTLNEVKQSKDKNQKRITDCRPISNENTKQQHSHGVNGTHTAVLVESDNRIKLKFSFHRNPIDSIPPPTGKEKFCHSPLSPPTTPLLPNNSPLKGTTLANSPPIHGGSKADMVLHHETGKTGNAICAQLPQSHTFISQNDPRLNSSRKALSGGENYMTKTIMSTLGNKSSTSVTKGLLGSEFVKTSLPESSPEPISTPSVLSKKSRKLSVEQYRQRKAELKTGLSPTSLSPYSPTSPPTLELKQSPLTYSKHGFGKLTSHSSSRDQLYPRKKFTSQPLVFNRIPKVKGILKNSKNHLHGNKTSISSSVTSATGSFDPKLQGSKHLDKKSGNIGISGKQTLATAVNKSDKTRKDTQLCKIIPHNIQNIPVSDSKGFQSPLIEISLAKEEMERRKRLSIEIKQLYKHSRQKPLLKPVIIPLDPIDANDSAHVLSSKPCSFNDASDIDNDRMQDILYSKPFSRIVTVNSEPKSKCHEDKMKDAMHGSQLKIQDPRLSSNCEFYKSKVSENYGSVPTTSDTKHIRCTSDNIGTKRSEETSIDVSNIENEIITSDLKECRKQNVPVENFLEEFDMDLFGSDDEVESKDGPSMQSNKTVEDHTEGTLDSSMRRRDNLLINKEQNTNELVESNSKCDTSKSSNATFPETESNVMELWEDFEEIEDLEGLEHSSGKTICSDNQQEAISASKLDCVESDMVEKHKPNNVQSISESLDKNVLACITSENGDSVDSIGLYQNNLKSSETDEDASDLCKVVIRPQQEANTEVTTIICNANEKEDPIEQIELHTGNGEKQSTNESENNDINNGKESPNMNLVGKAPVTNGEDNGRAELTRNNVRLPSVDESHIDTLEEKIISNSEVSSDPIENDIDKNITDLQCVKTDDISCSSGISAKQGEEEPIITNLSHDTSSGDNGHNSENNLSKGMTLTRKSAFEILGGHGLKPTIVDIGKLIGLAGKTDAEYSQGLNLKDIKEKLLITNVGSNRPLKEDASALGMSMSANKQTENLKYEENDNSCDNLATSSTYGENEDLESYNKQKRMEFVLSKPRDVQSLDNCLPAQMTDNNIKRDTLKVTESDLQNRDQDINVQIPTQVDFHTSENTENDKKGTVEDTNITEVINREGQSSHHPISGKSYLGEGDIDEKCGFNEIGEDYLESALADAMVIETVPVKDRDTDIDETMDDEKRHLLSSTSNPSVELYSDNESNITDKGKITQIDTNNANETDDKDCNIKKDSEKELELEPSQNASDIFSGDSISSMACNHAEKNEPLEEKSESEPDLILKQHPQGLTQKNSDQSKSSNQHIDTIEEPCSYPEPSMIDDPPNISFGCHLDEMKTESLQGGLPVNTISNNHVEVTKGPDSNGNICNDSVHLEGAHLDQGNAVHSPVSLALNKTSNQLTADIQGSEFVSSKDISEPITVATDILSKGSQMHDADDTSQQGMNAAETLVSVTDDEILDGIDNIQQSIQTDFVSNSSDMDYVISECNDSTPDGLQDQDSIECSHNPDDTKDSCVSEANIEHGSSCADESKNNIESASERQFNSANTQTSLARTGQELDTDSDIRKEKNQLDTGMTLHISDAYSLADDDELSTPAILTESIPINTISKESERCNTAVNLQVGDTELKNGTMNLVESNAISKSDNDSQVADTNGDLIVGDQTISDEQEMQIQPFGSRYKDLKIKDCFVNLGGLACKIPFDQTQTPETKLDSVIENDQLLEKKEQYISEANSCQKSEPSGGNNAQSFLLQPQRQQSADQDKHDFFGSESPQTIDNLPKKENLKTKNTRALTKPKRNKSKGRKPGKRKAIGAKLGVKAKQTSKKTNVSENESPDIDDGPASPPSPPLNLHLSSKSSDGVIVPKVEECADDLSDTKLMIEKTFMFTNDDIEDMPTILPSKRRRKQAKRTSEAEKPDESNLVTQRLATEFRKHNWLERKITVDLEQHSNEKKENVIVIDDDKKEDKEKKELMIKPELEEETSSPTTDHTVPKEHNCEVCIVNIQEHTHSTKENDLEKEGDSENYDTALIEETVDELPEIEVESKHSETSLSDASALNEEKVNSIPFTVAASVPLKDLALVESTGDVTTGSTYAEVEGTSGKDEKILDSEKSSDSILMDETHPDSGKQAQLVAGIRQSDSSTELSSLIKDCNENALPTARVPPHTIPSTLATSHIGQPPPLRPITKESNTSSSISKTGESETISELPKTRFRPLLPKPVGSQNLTIARNIETTPTDLSMKRSISQDNDVPAKVPRFENSIHTQTLALQTVNESVNETPETQVSQTVLSASSVTDLSCTNQSSQQEITTSKQLETNTNTIVRSRNVSRHEKLLQKEHDKILNKLKELQKIEQIKEKERQVLSNMKEKAALLLQMIQDQVQNVRKTSDGPEETDNLIDLTTEKNSQSILIDADVPATLTEELPLALTTRPSHSQTKDPTMERSNSTDSEASSIGLQPKYSYNLNVPLHVVNPYQQRQEELKAPENSASQYQGNRPSRAHNHQTIVKFVISTGPLAAHTKNHVNFGAITNMYCKYTKSNSMRKAKRIAAASPPITTNMAANNVTTTQRRTGSVPTDKSPMSNDKQLGANFSTQSSLPAPLVTSTAVNLTERTTIYPSENQPGRLPLPLPPPPIISAHPPNVTVDDLAMRAMNAALNKRSLPQTQPSTVEKVTHEVSGILPAQNPKVAQPLDIAEKQKRLSSVSCTTVSDARPQPANVTSQNSRTVTTNANVPTPTAPNVSKIQPLPHPQVAHPRQTLPAQAKVQLQAQGNIIPHRLPVQVMPNAPSKNQQNIAHPKVVVPPAKIHMHASHQRQPQKQKSQQQQQQQQQQVFVPRTTTAHTFEPINNKHIVRPTIPASQSINIPGIPQQVATAHVPARNQHEANGGLIRQQMAQFNIPTSQHLQYQQQFQQFQIPQHMLHKQHPQHSTPMVTPMPVNISQPLTLSQPMASQLTNHQANIGLQQQQFMQQQQHHMQHMLNAYPTGSDQLASKSVCASKAVTTTTAAANAVAPSSSNVITSPAVTSTVAAQKNAGVTAAPILCDVCASKAKFVCSGCKKVSYCSQPCQLRAWHIHSLQCSKK